MNIRLMKRTTPAAGVALAAAIGLLAVVQTAAATEAYATQTGEACVSCHTSPAGGALNAAGDAFKANGNKLPPMVAASAAGSDPAHDRR
jgi:hypothetical protein